MHFLVGREPLNLLNALLIELFVFIYLTLTLGERCNYVLTTSSSAQLKPDILVSVASRSGVLAGGGA